MKKIIVSFLVVFSFFSVEAINIKLLMGTHTILPEEFENCSPVMGLSFSEWGTAEQWYKLSARIQKAWQIQILDIVLCQQLVH